MIAAIQKCPCWNEGQENTGCKTDKSKGITSHFDVVQCCVAICPAVVLTFALLCMLRHFLLLCAL